MRTEDGKFAILPSTVNDGWDFGDEHTRVVAKRVGWWGETRLASRIRGCGASRIAGGRATSRTDIRATATNRTVMLII